MKKVASELLEEDGQALQEGLELGLCPAPEQQEVFIFCRSVPWWGREWAMHERFEKHIEEGLGNRPGAVSGGNSPR